MSFISKIFNLTKKEVTTSKVDIIPKKEIEKQTQTQQKVINWNQRLRDVKNEFGGNSVKLLYSTNFNKDFLNKFGQIYCRENFI